MLNFNKTIESPRVILRPIKKEDFEVMNNLTNDQNMWYYFTTDLSKETMLEDWINLAIKELENKKSLPFSIITVENDEIIGSTRVSNISQRDKRVEIGWTWIAKEYQGTGINSHVKKLLFKFLFEETETVRIELKTDVLNIPARKGMLKSGLIEEGILRSHTLMTNNRRRDTIFYSILKDEWPEKQ
ncbi:GNAT family N-acetyltransferase [Gramella sp. KN1008]|uniref:GNAT family N-acetyltransferase n=1 Tax=Gramella sp. KN1008 TaxID=2529298 RepID=UPI00103F0D7C|nr:GNAT family protein [Gramella sp. KN1008]TBW26562.1 N-acetyltransferase [Gramella sp. KN1008]